LRHERATEDVRQQASLYALGLLTQHEASSFGFHLGECPTCRTELEKIEHAVAKIGLATEEVAPPEGLKAALLAAIATAGEEGEDAGEPAEAADAAGADCASGAAPAASAPPPETSDAPVATEPQPGSEPASAPAERQAPSTVAPPLFTQSLGASGRGRSLATVFAWIFLVLFALLAAFALYAWEAAKDENRRLKNQVVAVQAELADAERLSERQQSDLDDIKALGTVPRLAGKPGVRVAQLRREAGAPDNTGLVLWDVEAGECTVVGSFSRPPAGQDYRLWFSAATGRVLVGTVPVNAGGRVAVTLDVPPQLPRGVVNVIVSVEPGGEAEAARTPTPGKFVAVGRLD
jgi:hypothetical protein